MKEEIQNQLRVEMNFCRRCGAPLSKQQGFMYRCQKGHTIFYDASPAAGLVVLNERNEVLMVKRAIDPGKGTLNIPGGFCDPGETLEQTAVREVLEETGVTPDDYSAPTFLTHITDVYDFGGEVRCNVGAFFEARLRKSVQLTPGADEAAVQWVPLGDIDVGSLHFASNRQVIALLLARENSDS